MLTSKRSRDTRADTARSRHRAVSHILRAARERRPLAGFFLPWDRRPLAGILLVLFFISISAAPAETPTVAHWRELSSPQYIWPNEGAIYYTLQAPNGTKVHLVVVDVKSGRWQFKPALNDSQATTSICAEKNKASAAINGGYFNLSDGASASHIVLDGRLAADPNKNKALMENPKLMPYIGAILNRSEIRFLEDRDFHPMIQIAAHKAPLPPGYSLSSSLQAGPRLLPNLTSEEEAFVRRDPDGKPVDGIGSMKPAARTAFGITTDGYAMMLCAASAKQDPESHGMTLPEVAELLKNLGCSEAINLDGGSSTTMFVRVSPSGEKTYKSMPPGRVVCGKEPETLVKSVLLLQQRSK